MLVPLSAALAALLDFAIGFLALGALMACYGLAPGPSGLVVIPIVIATAATAAGAGMWLGGLRRAARRR